MWGKISRIRSVEAEKGRATLRLTNTVALAALRSRRYLSRYFSFWLFFGSFFILALVDCSGARGEAGPPSRLMVRPRYGASRERPTSAPRPKSASFVSSGLPEAGFKESTPLELSQGRLLDQKSGNRHQAAGPPSTSASASEVSPARKLRNGAGCV